MDEDLEDFNAIIYANNTDIVRLQKQTEIGQHAFLNSILYAYNSSNITVDCERGWFNCQNMSIYTYDDAFSLLNPSIPDKLTIICNDLFSDECYQAKVYTSYNDYNDNDIWSCMYIHNGVQWNCVQFIDSLSPTSSPTMEPTIETLSPTLVPTIETSAPTTETLLPTIETSQPTIEPTIETISPTTTPTLPTLLPTVTPTIKSISSKNKTNTLRVIIVTNSIVFGVAISCFCLIMTLVSLHTRKMKPVTIFKSSFNTSENNSCMPSNDSDITEYTTKMRAIKSSSVTEYQYNDHNNADIPAMDSNPIENKNSEPINVTTKNVDDPISNNNAINRNDRVISIVYAQNCKDIHELTSGYISKDSFQTKMGSIDRELTDHEIAREYQANQLDLNRLTNGELKENEFITKNGNQEGM